MTHEKAHFNPKSTRWIISLIVMIILSAAVIFGSKALYGIANQKYNEPVEVSFTIAKTAPVDISAQSGNEYNVTAVEEAYDEAGNLVAYIVTGTTVGYNAESPIEMSTVISADGTLVCGVEILSQKETEYLGVRICQATFTDQFTGRYLPVVAAGSTDKGSPIDMIAKSTISSEAVVDGVNNAKDFCLSFLIAE